MITATNNVVDTDAAYTFTYTATSAASYVIFEIESPTTYLTSLPTSSIACGTGSDKCLTFELNTQWVVFIPASATTSISVTLPSTTLKNGAYVDSPTSPTPNTFNLRTLDSSGNLLNKVKNTFALTEATITSITFDKDTTESVLYQVSEHLFVISWTSIKDISAGGSISLVFSGISQQSSSDFYCVTTGLTILNTNSVEGVTCVQYSSNVIKVSNLDAMAAATNIGVTLRLVTGTTNVGANVKVLTYRDSSQSQLVETGTASVGTSYNSGTAMQDFWVNSPVGIPGKIGEVVPIVLQIQPTSDSINTLQVTFPTGFSSASSLIGDYTYCSLDATRVACSYTLSPLVYTVTLSSALSNSVSQKLILSTLYTNPLNGILLPITSGNYNIQVNLLTDSTIIEQNSQYIFVAPEKLPFFDVRMAHRTQDEENFFIISIKTSKTLNAYNDAAIPGKIHILFPKYATDGVTQAFDSDLGTGLSASGILPCSFDGLTALTTTRLKCRLIPGYVSTATDMVRVEVINFDTVAIGTSFQVRIAKVKNPSTLIVDADFKIDMFQITLTTGAKEFIHQEKFNLFMNIDNNSPDTTDTYLVDYSTGALKFTGTRVVYETAQSLALKIWTQSNALNLGDFFITYLPSSFSGLQDSILGSCVASVSTCYSFPDGNMVIYEIASTIAGNTATDAPITPLDVFTSIPLNGLSFYSYVIQNQIYTHKVKHVYQQSDLNSLIGVITSTSLTTLHADVLQKGRKNTEVIVSFIVPHAIPSTGAIVITFPSNFPKVYGSCRSFVTAVSTPSALTSKLGTMMGGISCYIINTNAWYITGFQAVVAASAIKIYGMVDLPNSNTGTSLSSQ